jgi:alpha-amylase
LLAATAALAWACSSSQGKGHEQADDPAHGDGDGDHPGDGDGDGDHPGDGDGDGDEPGDGDAGTGGDGDGDGDLPVYDSPVPRAGAVFVHLFEWRWQDIAEECERYLGPAGFEAVQISPPSEHLLLKSQGYPWWQRYQTVSYDLTESRSGTQAELEDMVKRCARQGVGIYVDAVINHMSAKANGVGSAGTMFSKYDYAPLYSESDFHSPHCAIQDTDYASDAHAVQTCELLALSDLDTGSEHVQERIADYLAGLVQLGVRGFRIDAAKHMAADDLRGIVRKVREQVGEARAPYFYFEVFGFGGEAVTPEEYLTLGDVAGDDRASAIEFRYSLMGDRFLQRGGSTLAELAAFAGKDSGFLPSERAVVFVNNHDTQRNDGLFYQDGDAFDLATIYMLAAPYGYPSLMSSYAFARPAGRDKGPPSDDEGHTRAIYPSGASEPDCATEQVPTGESWVCEHRRRYVPGMLAFRKATAGTALERFWDNGANQIAFARGERGFVVINGESEELSRTFDTGLPAGEYCDAAQGSLQRSMCTGRVIRVEEDGTARLTLSAHSAAAIPVGARR